VDTSTGQFLSALVDERYAGGGGGGVDPDDVGYDIVVAVGQSNASRTGSPVLVDVYDTPNPRIWQYAASGTYANKIIKAVDPLYFPAADLGEWVCNAMQFSREWIKRVSVNRQVLIVPAAVGGSSLVGGSWAVGGTYYNDTVTLTNAALTAAGANSRVVAFLWIQGEYESTVGTTQAAYAAALDPMIAGLRAAITGASGAPFVVGSMVPEWRNAPNGSSLAIHAAHVDTPNRVANTFFVDGPTGMNEGSGGIHYTAEGQREMGKRMCEALWAADAAPPAPTGLDATPGVASVALTWVGVTATPPVSDYVVQYKTSASGTWLTFSDGTSTTPAATVTGLVDETPYDFRVEAVNSVGTGAASSTVSATPTSTTPLPDPTYLIDARELGLSAGASITTWADLSDNTASNDVTQSSSGARPTFRTTGLGGGPSVEFDGGDSLGVNSIPNFFTDGNGDFTVAVVASVTTLGVDPRGLIALRDDANGFYHVVVLSDGTISFSTLAGGGSGSNASTGAISTSTPFLFIGTRDSSGAKAYLNGTTGTPGSALANVSQSGIWPLTIGRVSDSLWPHNGHIAYAAMWAGVLTTPEREALEEQLMDDFGI
jgi:hypothetical protein